MHRISKYSAKPQLIVLVVVLVIVIERSPIEHEDEDDDENDTQSGFAEGLPSSGKAPANLPGRRGSQSVYTGGTPEVHRMHKGFSGVPPVCLRCTSGVLSPKGQRIGRLGPK